ncbi:hypothetical protein AVEN_106176-1 [Araneus ventricosus]|uniref:Uncharacterized protein n=1 Tax=Araneus ventricosus TaxID=182803 RepID=A0A4Y2RH49_ARAVE|nr:hypothetical protein AVEN_106176-1 [Araneus ventricosus]
MIHSQAFPNQVPELGNSSIKAGSKVVCSLVSEDRACVEAPDAKDGLKRRVACCHSYAKVAKICDWIGGGTPRLLVKDLPNQSVRCLRIIFSGTKADHSPPL